MAHKLHFILTLCMLAVMHPCHAENDSPETADSIMRLQEVSVTAIKQGLTGTPEAAAVTVVGTAQIERLNIVTMKQVSGIAPNFYIPDYGSRMTSSIYVRGLGARIDQPAVGLNVDNVPILNKDNYDFDLVDIARIEVLRGPQSTLYGRNTMGGLINIYTLSPLRYSGVKASAEWSSGNTRKISAGIYRMVRHGLGMSVTGSMTASNGFFTNKNNGEKVDKEKQASLRWRTAWRGASGPMIDNVASVIVTRQGGYPYASAATGLIDYNDTCFYRRTGITDGLTMKWRWAGISASSITSVQYIDDNMTLDQDFTAYDYFTLTQRRKEWALTQDVIVRGDEGSYQWMGGLFGFYKRADMHAPVTFKGYGIEQLITRNRNEINPLYPIQWNDPSFVLDSRFRMPVWGVALYHQSSLTAGAWDLTAGIRMDYERSAIDYHSFCNTSYTIMDARGQQTVPMHHIPLEIDDRGSLHLQFLQILPKFTATWNLPGSPGDRIYASVAKGYKSGGYNTQMFSDVLQQKLMNIMGLGMKYDINEIISYRPEKSWNYEIGAHLELPVASISVDAALFHIDCTDQQLTMFPEGTTTGRIMANAGRTRSRGAEISVKATPAAGLDINLSYGFTDARFVKFVSGKTDYAGKIIPYAPRNTLFAGATYRYGIDRDKDAAIVANVNVRGLGRIYWDEANTASQPFYAQAGASAALVCPKFSLDLWCENITGCNFDTFYFVSIGNSFLQRGKPRRFGVTLSIKFN